MRAEQPLAGGLVPAGGSQEVGLPVIVVNTDDDSAGRRSLSIGEACELLVDHVLQLSRVRADRDFLRTMLLEALGLMHRQHRDIANLRSTNRRLHEQLRVLRNPTTDHTFEGRHCA